MSSPGLPNQANWVFGLLGLAGFWGGAPVVHYC